LLAGLSLLLKYQQPLQIANSEGEIYSLSTRTPHFKWIQDLSSLDKVFTITAGNNGQLYVTVPVRALVLALDVSTGNVLWQRTVGPLSLSNCGLVVDLNGNIHNIVNQLLISNETYELLSLLPFDDYSLWKLLSIYVH